MTTKGSQENLLFDHRTLRLIVGSIAFVFPFTVYILAASITSSISASYYTNARDTFVGFLFVIGALLMAYMGQPHRMGCGALSDYLRGLYSRSEIFRSFWRRDRLVFNHGIFLSGCLSTPSE